MPILFSWARGVFSEQSLNFCVWGLRGGEGVSCAKRWGSKSSFRPSRSLFSLGFVGGNLGCPGNLAGRYPPSKKICEINSEKLQNCSCIK